ncbi:hypothetical protein AB0958_21890 [Streptomyces sp. NPDC006655]|uniref:hypothetical protein n=1 Tax=Streptomyces sp. NPDC006655 TaxID=3156898 RepID=UPI003454CDEC
MSNEPETLPDDHTRELTLSLTVAEFREVMRSVAYRSAGLADSDPLVALLDGAQEKIGAAWVTADPEHPASGPLALCTRCRRHVAEGLTRKTVSGAVVCSPDNPTSYDECQRVYNGV